LEEPMPAGRDADTQSESKLQANPQAELNALERLGKALKADKSHHCSCQQNYLFSVH